MRCLSLLFAAFSATLILQMGSVAAGDLAGGSSSAAQSVTGTGAVIMKDRFHSRTDWGRELVLPRDGQITRVMDGTYGFSIFDASGKRIADFLLPEQAVGLKLAAGTYRLEPYVCEMHRHHFVEVTAAY